MRSLFLSFIVTICLTSLDVNVAASQQLPSTDIYTVGLSNGRIDENVSPLKNISNRAGYDNYPSFASVGRGLHFVSDRSGSSVEIYFYSFTTGRSQQLTYSTANHYSPRQLSNSEIACIIDDGDGNVRLWSLLEDGLSGTPLLHGASSVGGFALIDDNRFALLILGESMKMAIADISKAETKTVATDIGRTMSRIPGSTDVSFMQKVSSDEWMIKKVNPDTGAISDIAPIVGQGQDFVWTPDGKLLMASGSTLYEWQESGGKWNRLHDFSQVGITAISRLAVNPENDLLAFVAERAD